MRGGTPYDVILLGAGLSGLLAAALLARRGRHVLVLEEEAIPGGLSHPTLREAPRGPALFLGFEREGLYDRLFLELGLSLSILKKEGVVFRRSTSPLQIVLPNHRLNFYLDSSELFDELAREFPEHVEGLGALLTELDRWEGILRPAYYQTHRRSPKGFGEWVGSFQERLKLRRAVWILRRQKALAFLKPFGLDPEFCRGLELLLLLFTGRTATEATGLDLVLLMGLLRREVVAIRGGIPQLTDLLVKVIREHQGEVIFSQPLEALAIQGRRVVALKTREGEIPVTGNVIANIPSSRLRQSGSERAFLTFFFSIAADVLPSAMKEHLVMTRSLEKPPLADNFLFLSVGESETTNQCTLRVFACLPESQEPTPSELERLRDLVQAHLTYLMPFSGPSLTFVGYDFWTKQAGGRLSALSEPLLSHARAKGRDEAAYYTLPIRNLFVLPDQMHRPAADLRQARSALKLVEHLQ